MVYSRNKYSINIIDINHNLFKYIKNKFEDNDNYNLFKYIKSKFEDNDRLKSRIIVKMNNINQTFAKYISIEKNDTLEKRTIMTITETNDEWFYVWDNRFKETSIYKCDQLEGIIKYIEDNE